jgi:hypothetical protein
MLGLGNFMPYKYTQIVLLALGGIFMIIGAVIGPETKDLDFAAELKDVESGAATAPARRTA